MVGTPYWHLFFDTSTLYSKSSYVDTSLLTSPHICYVSQFCVEELALQLLHDKDGIKNVYKDFQRFEPALGMNVSLPQLKADAELLTYFRNAVTEKLGKERVFDPLPHDANEQIKLFAERYPGDYKDTMILASSIKFAAKKGIKECGFVTNEGGNGLENFITVAKVMEATYKVRTTVIRRDELKAILNVTPTQIEELTKLLEPKLIEFLQSTRRELVDQASANDRVFGPINPKNAVLFRERFSNANADLSPIHASLHRATPYLNGALQTEKAIPISIRMAAYFELPGLHWVRLYEAVSKGTTRYDGKQFLDAQVSSIEFNWMPFG